MKKQLLKILMLTSLTSYLYSCDAVKRVTEDAHLLTKTSVIVNNKKDNTETINSLIHQKPNRKILGIPLRLHIYNTARPNRDSLFEVWLDKKPNRRERLEKRYSKKQINKLKESAVGFNNWLKKTGEAPVIVSEDKNKRSVRRVKDYYVNNGWFDVEAEYNLEKKDNKRAEVTYEVETGTPFLIDSITNIIKSPIVDSLYQNIKKKGLIQTGDQYKTSNFEQERDRIASELRNSGVYHFNQDYITFEMDTIGTNKKVNISLRIQDRAIRTADSIRREPFEIYRISNVNIITDYSFENRNKPFQDSISYGGYKLYSYGKIRYRPKALTDAVFIAPREVFRDLDRTRTYFTVAI